jgi:protein-S-isoprenylcysteine O-methyltransferase Ste14
MSENIPNPPARSAASGFVAKLVVVIFSLGVYLGLAVIGIGGLGAFFSHPALIAVAVLTAFLTIASFFTEGNISTGVREDRSNRWVIPALVLPGFVSAWVCAYTDRLDFWTIDGDETRWIGVVLYGVGGVLRLAPVFVLGRRFSGLVAIQPDHALVTDGIYSVVRNPSYVGLLMGSAGWALAFRSGVGLVVTALMLIPLIARIHSEEKLLRSEFGHRYDAYCARTWRLVPGIY